MTAILFLLTTAVVLGAMWIAFARTRDPVHPTIFLGPMMLYMYVLRPWRMTHEADVAAYLAGSEGFTFVLLVNLLSVTAFSLGALATLRKGALYPAVTLRLDADEDERRAVRHLAIFFGLLAVVAFVYGVQSAGGLIKAYSRVKGGGSTESGYLGEAPLLSYPAILLYLMGQAGSRWRPLDVGFVALFSAPNLIHGVLGTRRGPLFLVLATLALGWVLTMSRRRSALMVLVLVGAIGLLVLLVFSQRSRLYLQSQEEFSSENFQRVALSGGAEEGNTFVAGGGMMLTANEAGRNAWGVRMFLTLLVRPIPRQIWPTKYEDALSLAGMAQTETGFYSPREWKDAVGWIPVTGAASGFAADLFIEFSWLGIAFCWLYGYLWAFFWWKAREHGGLWSVVLVLLLALGVYVPTQSVSAVLHRFLFMGILLWIAWRIAVGSRFRRELPLPAAQESA